LILIESLLAKESKMHCSIAYSSMLLDGASSLGSFECADESDMVGRLRRKMRSRGRKMRCRRKARECFIDEI
jgi:hypothetical protein